MRSVILAGGYGTRIRDVSQDIPKPMIPIGTHPVLWHIMKGYAHYGVGDFILCLGYKGEDIKNYFINYRLHQSDVTLHLKSHKIDYHSDEKVEDWRIVFAETGLDTYTGARVKQVQKYIEKDDYFFLTYGDGVGDVDIDALLSFHKKHGKLMTVTGTHPPGRFGDLMIDGNKGGCRHFQL